jgi:hypothetical protein
MYVEDGKTWCKIWNIFLGVAGTSSPVTSPSWPCNRLTNCRQEKYPRIGFLICIIGKLKQNIAPTPISSCLLQSSLLNYTNSFLQCKNASLNVKVLSTQTLRAENTNDGTVKGRRLGPPWSICFWTVHNIWKIGKYVTTETKEGGECNGDWNNLQALINSSVITNVPSASLHGHHYATCE